MPIKGLIMEDFRFIRLLADEAIAIPSTTITATSKDHRDVHYLYKMRKSLKILVGDENLKGLTEEQLKALHIAVVKSLIDNNHSHWYDDYDSDLDDSLPDDLKIASDGYDPPTESSIFDLEEHYETEYPKLLEEANALETWSAPTKRKKVPSGHFIDSKNKKYPYKNKDGSINCKGIKTAYSYARGARGAPNRPGIASKAKALHKKHCGSELGEKKKTEDNGLFGTLTKLE